MHFEFHYLSELIKQPANCSQLSLGRITFETLQMRDVTNQILLFYKYSSKRYSFFSFSFFFLLLMLSFNNWVDWNSRLHKSNYVPLLTTFLCFYIYRYCVWWVLVVEPLYLELFRLRIFLELFFSPLTFTSIVKLIFNLWFLLI